MRMPGTVLVAAAFVGLGGIYCVETYTSFTVVEQGDRMYTVTSITQGANRTTELRIHSSEDSAWYAGSEEEMGRIQMPEEQMKRLRLGSKIICRKTYKETSLLHRKKPWSEGYRCRLPYKS